MASSLILSTARGELLLTNKPQDIVVSTKNARREIWKALDATNVAKRANVL
jgi:hypothetical protein